jgi:hypothetical protein
MAKSMKILKTSINFLFLFYLLIGNFAKAEVFSLEGATGWKVESYGPTSVALWYTGSKCPSGGLSLAAGLPASEHSRLYGTVMAAKMSGNKIFVFYDYNGTTCTIVSYGIS